MSSRRLHFICFLVMLCGLIIFIVPKLCMANYAKCYNDGKLVYQAKIDDAILSDGTLILQESATHEYVVALMDCIISFPEKQFKDMRHAAKIRKEEHRK